MRYAWILATVIAWPVSAADFRDLNFGSSCAPIRGLEEARGSAQIPWKSVEDAELIAFNAQAFERDVSIVYHCVGGQLFAGRYFLPFEDFYGVVRSYGQVREQLVGIHGSPLLDTSPWSYVLDPGQDPRAVLSDPTKYMTIWTTPRVRVSLSLMPRNEGSKTDWRVFVMTSANRT